MTSKQFAVSDKGLELRWSIGALQAASLWFFLYSNLIAFANLIIGFVGLSRETAIGEAFHFFFYDTPKVLLLLTGMARIVGYGVMGTPGLIIDGKVVHAGSLPEPKKVPGWLQEI